MAAETPRLPSPTPSEQERWYWLDENDKCYEKDVSLPEISGRWGIPTNDIVDTPNAATFFGYAPSLDQSESSKKLRDNLHDLSPTVARDHIQKLTALQHMKFRLIMPGGNQILEKIPYIAVSYRWTQTHKSGMGTAYDIHSVTPNLEARPASTEMHSLPFSPILYKALLTERASPNVGIWIDQLCIKQDNKEEKKYTIPAMDLIYGKASVVVVILGDICLNKAEFKTLIDMTKEIRGSRVEFGNRLMAASVRVISQLGAIEPGDSFDPSMLPGMGNSSPHNKTELSNSSSPPIEASPGEEELSTDMMHAINSLARKILSAEWFERAWCNHEFRTSRRHVFLVRAESTTQDSPPRVVRFTTPFLYELLSRSDGENLEDQLSTHHYLLRLKSIAIRDAVAQGAVGEGWLRAYTNISRFKAGGDPDVKDATLQKKYATRDKYTILLNTVGKGISYKGCIMSEEEFCRNLLAVALAARDPTALCTTGRWQRLGQRWSWMQQPTDSDFLASSNKSAYEYPPMPEFKMIIDPSSESRWISLDLSVIYQNSFSTSTEEQSLRQRAVCWAQMFIDICIELKISFDDPGTYRANLINLHQIHLYHRNNLINTLGGCIVFGREWFARACFPHDASQLDPNTRQALLTSLDHFGLDGTADETRAHLNQADGWKAAKTI